MPTARRSTPKFCRWSLRARRYAATPAQQTQTVEWLGSPLACGIHATPDPPASVVLRAWHTQRALSGGVLLLVRDAPADVASTARARVVEEMGTAAQAAALLVVLSTGGVHTEGGQEALPTLTYNRDNITTTVYAQPHRGVTLHLRIRLQPLQYPQYPEAVFAKNRVHDSILFITNDPGFEV